MASPKMEVVTSALKLGESPHWDSRSSSLLYVDIQENEVHRLHVNEGKVQEFVLKLDRKVSFVIPVKDQENKYVLGQEHDLVLLTWDGRSNKPDDLEVLASADTEDDKKENSFNDGKADAQGRVWAGTYGALRSLTDMDMNKGSIYSLRPGRQLTREVEGFTLSNGLAWSPEGKTFYFIDSIEHRIYAFAFDSQDGKLSNRREVFNFKANNIKGIPDGMTVDAEGKLWVASFGGSQVLRVDPESHQVLKVLDFPSPNVTAMAWGGENLDELYVTTAQILLSDAERAAYPQAGTTFRVTGLGVRGLPCNEVVL